MMWKEIFKCRLCGSSDIQDSFSLGMQIVKDFLDSPHDGSKKGPLDLVLCKGCGFLQLKHTFDKQYLYTHYWYRSGTSPTMVKELAGIVHKAENIVRFNPDDIVIDIGANDGTLLRQYNMGKIQKVGFEPSNLWQYGASHDTMIINDFFNAESFVEKFPGKKAKIVTSIAMFYDLDDPNAFTEDIKSILDPLGVWIVQMNYLGLMLNNLGYDNICHEHVGYYSLTTMKYLLARHSLEVFDVELNNVNGGSFRLYIKHVGDTTKKTNKEAINRAEQWELENHISDQATFSKFDSAIRHQKSELQQLISDIVDAGKTIFIYGASTRGLVILEYCGIDETKIQYATDKNSDKWEKYLSGTGIKIINLEEYRKLKPDYLLVLSYQYANEIAYQERALMEAGGKLIIPLPAPKVLDQNYFIFKDDDNTKENFLSGYDKL